MAVDIVSVSHILEQGSGVSIPTERLNTLELQRALDMARARAELNATEGELVPGSSAAPGYVQGQPR